jgi:hypothetical protein
MTRMLRAGTMLMPAVSFAMQSCWVFAWLSLLERATVGSVGIAPATVVLFLAAAAWRAYLPQIVRRRVLLEVLFWASWPLVAALAGKLILFGDMPWSHSGWFFALPRAALYLLYETRAAELLLLLGSGLAWFLGRRLASQPVSYGRLLGDFQFGLVMLLAAFLVSHGLEQGLHRPVLLSLCFFGVSLSGIAVARGAIGSESKASLSRGHFTGTILTLIAIVCALGLLVGMAVTPDVLRVLLDAMRYIGHLLQALMAWLASLMPQPEIEPGIPAGPATGDDSALREFYRSLPVPALLKRGLYIVWVTTVLGMLLYGLWQLCSQVLAWLRRRMDMGEGAELESLDTGFLSELAAFVRRMVALVRTMAARVFAAVLRTGGRGQPATVRTVYVGFVRWAGKKVLAREPWQSPHEYMSTLAEYLPAATPDLAVLTEAYVLARYGQHEPDDGIVDEMTGACKRIRRTPRVRKHDSSHEHKEGG